MPSGDKQQQHRPFRAKESCWSNVWPLVLRRRKVLPNGGMTLSKCLHKRTSSIDSSLRSLSSMPSVLTSDSISLTSQSPPPSLSTGDDIPDQYLSRVPSPSTTGPPPVPYHKYPSIILRSANLEILLENPAHLNFHGLVTLIERAGMLTTSDSPNAMSNTKPGGNRTDVSTYNLKFTIVTKTHDDFLRWRKAGQNLSFRRRLPMVVCNDATWQGFLRDLCFVVGPGVEAVGVVVET
ncbi:hypothetical protein DFH27DRAFT_529365 [Peziza echinospora]|nr:hypothetical protein DFH27DRAFT_529365 [Peziza echinospora]